MNKKLLSILIIINLAQLTVISANAPVSSIGEIINATTTPSSTVVPVTVSNFFDIGAFTLTLNYQTSVITLTGVSMHPAFTGVTINTTTPGTVVLTWTGTAGISLPDNVHLFDLIFTYISGTSALTWNTSGTACQYKKYQGGSMLVLNDLPKTSYYINGVVTNHAAPVTYAPVLQSEAPGNKTIQIRVNQFQNIGSLSLMVSYNPVVLTYQNTYTPNPAFTANFVVGNQPGPNGSNYLLIQWFGNATNLADSSVLVSLNFVFSTSSGTVNYSVLNWYDNGPSCSFTDGQGNPLYDSRTSYYYKDGHVASQVSPFTWMPSISNASPGGTVPVAVKVNNFSGITFLSLAFKYDPAVLSLPAGAFTPNPAFGSSLTLTDNAPGSDGKRTIILSWTGTAITLPAGSDLVTIDFTYNSGWTTLKWCSGADSCNYKEAQHNSIWKTPFGAYYQDGSVTYHSAPKTIACNTTGTAGQSLSIPVKVNHFINIGHFLLTLVYDPAILASPVASLVPSIGGSFTYSNPGPGQIVMQWTGSGVSLPDSSVLINIAFACQGENSSLRWYWNGGSCSYAEGSGMPPLFDIPQSQFYIDGTLIKAPVLNVKIYLEGPYGSGSMSTVLQSSGLIPHLQPYSVSPWNYSGNEQVTTIPANVTDWVLVELRTQPGPAYTVARRAGFLKNDGSIKGLDGSGALGFSGVQYGNYYIVIRHRNHLAVMSAVPVLLNASSSLYDFTTGSGTVYGGSNGYKLIDPTASKWGMIAGDGFNDGCIFTDDYTNHWIPAFGQTNVYSLGDFNMDGSVSENDYINLWKQNFGMTNPIP
jgi:hypothetical protein